MLAQLNGLPAESNPYPRSSVDSLEWADGWQFAKDYAVLMEIMKGAGR